MKAQAKYQQLGIEDRRDHLGGALGEALARHFTQQGWITRKKHLRVVPITGGGSAQFKRLGIQLPGCATPASGLQRRRHHEDAIFIGIQPVARIDPHALDLHRHVALAFTAFFGR